MDSDNDQEWTEEDLVFRKAVRDIPLKEIRTSRLRFEQYLAHVLRVWERIRNDPKEYARFRELLEIEEAKSASKFDSPAGFVH